MGGTASLISSVVSLVNSQSSSSDDSLKKERAAREAEQAKQETEDRKRDRAKVVEAREAEAKRKKESLLSQGSASLKDDPEVVATGLKQKLGE